MRLNLPAQRKSLPNVFFFRYAFIQRTVSLHTNTQLYTEHCSVNARESFAKWTWNANRKWFQSMMALVRYEIHDMRYETGYSFHVVRGKSLLFFSFIFALHNKNGDLDTIKTMLVFLGQVLLRQNGEQVPIESISGNFQEKYIIQFDGSSALFDK